MRASIIVPVWNGDSVIADCLNAVVSNSGRLLQEIICVDNASADASAQIIADRFPQARLLPQPVNLGFAGGVNAGMAAATGDVFVLLNQDCLPQTGWLDAIADAFGRDDKALVVGCTILDPSNNTDHAGAVMSRPLAYGEHLLDASGGVRESDYVTGAAFAIRCNALTTIGAMDDGFYPAYYEEADYCYRVRRHGGHVMYAPSARIGHLRASREAYAQPIKHTATQHRMRYRFVMKHWSLDETLAFFAAETEAAQREQSVYQAIGRVLGIRGTLRNLPEILAARARDLGDPASPAHKVVFSARFAELHRVAFAQAEKRVANLPEEMIRGSATPKPRSTARKVINRVKTWLGISHLSQRTALLEALTDYDFI